MNSPEQPPERRQGNTGVWTFLMYESGKVWAMAEWNRPYQSNPEQWEALPLI